MDKLKRRSFIKNHLLKYGSASINDLAKLLGVSTMTIRRDIDYFKKCGLASVNYGGVYIRKQEAVVRSEIDTVFDGFMKEIEPNSTLYTDSPEFAAFLACNYTSRKFTIFTCSLKIMNILSHCENIRLSSVPGVFGKECYCFCGATAINYLQKYLFDYSIVYATAMDESYGFLCDNISVGEIKSVAAQNSKKVFVIMNKESVEMQTIIKFARFCDVKVLGTTVEIDDTRKNILQNNNIKLISKHKEPVNQI
ncbi:MAG: DeoR/GlpR family DNA-binding transcription regulator [Oscillospiraceae bacterium]